MYCVISGNLVLLLTLSEGLPQMTGTIEIINRTPDALSGISDTLLFLPIIAPQRTRSTLAADKTTLSSPINPSAPAPSARHAAIAGLEILGPVLLMLRVSLEVWSTNSSSLSFEASTPFQHLSASGSLTCWQRQAHWRNSDMRNNCSPELAVTVFSLPATLDGLPERFAGQQSTLNRTI